MSNQVESIKSPLDRAYTSIHKLPLSLFVDIVMEEDLSLLIISGTPPPELLSIAWEQISEQYADSIEDQAYVTQKKSLIKKIARYKFKLETVHRMLHVLEQYYVKEFADVVCELMAPSKLTFDITDPDGYDKTLKSAFTRSKSIALNLQIAEDELEALVNRDKEKNTGGKPTREYFSKILINLSNHAGYQLSDKISVFEFCQRVKDLNAYCEKASAVTSQRKTVNQV